MAKEVIVKLKNDQGFSSPSQDIRQILMIELKGFFANDLQVEASPWARGVILWPEMEKAADMADMPVLFFSPGASF